MAKTKIPGEYLKDSVVRFTAKAGENITKGQSVYISGISGEVPVVSLADADDTNKMPAFGLAESTVSTNGSIEVTSNGTLAGIDTSSYTLGDILYISTTAGSLTNDPSGLEASKVQNIGMVQRVHANNGSIKVGGAGRTNATPNLNDGNIFVGNSSNKSVSDAFTDVLNDQAGINSSANATAITIDSSENVGIGTSSITNNTLGKATYFGNSTSSITGDSSQARFWLGNNWYYNSGDKFIGTGYANLYTQQSGNHEFLTSTASGTAGAATTFTSVLKINSSGNVGIGETSPQHNLHIKGSADTGIQLTKDGVIAGRMSAVSTGLAFGVDGANGTTERMRIDSSGNVGIGLATPTEKLTVAGNILANASNGSGFKLNGGNAIVRQDSGMAFQTNSGERLRIDSSGNVIVGKTSTSFSTDGAVFYGSGYNDFVNTSAPVQSLNRQTSDGAIVNYYKDAALIGSIGVNSGDIYIASTGTYSAGLMFEGSSGARDIRPCSSTGALLDGSVDLGDSTARFNDLYLGGGVHLGGTGSANKLDDYEEGTFDPTLTTDSGSVTMYTTYNTLAYTKVGRVVTITGMLALTSVSSPTGQLIFGNLPFTMASLTNKAGQTRPSIHIYASGSAAPTQNHYFPAFISFSEGGTSGVIVGTYASASDTTIANWMAAGSDIFVNFSYITD